MQITQRNRTKFVFIILGRDSIGAEKILRIVRRDSWLAQPPSSKPELLKLPVSRVVVIPTQTDDCITQVI